MNPIRLIPAAIFEKEVRSQGRRWGTYLGRGLYTALLIGLLTIVFSAVTNGDMRPKGARALQELQTIAPAMTIAVLWFQYVMLALMAPLLTGPSICDERRAGTLATLLTTPLTAGQIVLGKLLGALVQVVILALLAAPMLFVIRVFGGVPVQIIVAGTALAITTAILSASLAILASVRAKRGTTASVAGFLGALSFHLGPIMLLMIGAGAFKIIPLGTAYVYGFLTCGPGAMGMVTAELFGQGGPPGMGLSMSTIWIANSAYSLILSVLALWLTVARMRRVMVAVGAGTQSVPTKPSRRQKRTAARARASAVESGATVSQESDPTERFGRDRGEVSDRPVLWRELRQPLFSRRRDPWLISIGLGSILIAVYMRVGIDEPAVHAVPAMIGFFILLVQAATLPTSSITGEREGRTWDVLLTTRLSSWSILSGKVIGNLKRMIFVPLFVGVLLCTVGLYGGAIHPTLIFQAVLIGSAPVFFLTCTGVLASLWFRRSVHAAAANVCLGLALWVGVPILVAFASINSRNQGERVLWSNPMALASLAGDGGLINNWNQRPVTVPSNSLFELPKWKPLHELQYHGFNSGAIGFWRFSAYLGVYWCVYTGLGIGALKLASVTFNSRAGRPS